MTRPTCAWRLSWLVAATFQLLVPTAWSVTDARAESVSAHAAGAHVEATGSHKCPRFHPRECVVCVTLATVGAPVAPATAPVLVTHESAARPADAAPYGSSARAPGDPPQRAPPF
jgi:hypothetical protein